MRTAAAAPRVSLSPAAGQKRPSCSTCDDQKLRKRARRCEHPRVVRAVSELLFPMQTTWAHRVSSDRYYRPSLLSHPSSKAARRWTQIDIIAHPANVRNILACSMYRFGAKHTQRCRSHQLLGPIDVRVELAVVSSSSWPWWCSKSGELSNQENARVASELLQALRVVLANQRPQHEEDERTDPWTCQRSPLPPVTVRVSARYWDRTVFWLCEALSLLCARYTVTLPTMKTPPQLLSPLLFDRNNGNGAQKLGVRWCALRWRLRMWLRLLPYGQRCAHCVRRVFQIFGAKSQLFSRYRHSQGISDIETIVTLSRFVHEYDDTMRRCDADEACCPDHREWSAATKLTGGLEVLLNLPPVDIRYKANDASQLRVFGKRRTMNRWAEFARDVASNLGCSGSCTNGRGIAIHFPSDSLRLFPIFCSLLGERVRPRLLYDNTCNVGLG